MRAPNEVLADNKQYFNIEKSHHAMSKRKNYSISDLSSCKNSVQSQMKALIRTLTVE